MGITLNDAILAVSEYLMEKCENCDNCDEKKDLGSLKRKVEVDECGEDSTAVNPIQEAEGLSIEDSMELVEAYLEEKKSAASRAIGVAGYGALTAGDVHMSQTMRNFSKEKKKLIDSIQDKLDAENEKDDPDGEKVRELKAALKKAKSAKRGADLAGLAFDAQALKHGANAFYNLTKESVDEMRLRVFEAADTGIIGEDEKALMLEYLDLENYE